MRKRVGGFVLVSVLGLMLSGCQIPGNVQFVNENGRWRATSASVNFQDITPSSIQQVEDRLNGN